MTKTIRTGRRSLLKAGLFGCAGFAVAPLLGLTASRTSWAQQAGTAAANGAAGAAGAGGGAARASVTALSDRLTLVSGVPGNVLALAADDGVVLVDSGAAGDIGALRQALDGARVRMVVNTHYHADQTGGNAAFGEAGATICAHEITRQWLSSDYYVPAEDRWVAALPRAGRPTRTFRRTESLTAGAERLECGYLIEAHTRGDIYVYFRDANVLAVGDVASPVRDPVLDWYAGGWLGGRVDAMDDLLEVANADT